MDVRLIDADALKSHIDRLECNGGSANDREIVDKMLHKVFPQIIDNESTIDAQPVKRGKWSEYSRNALETYIECTNCCIASRPIHLQMVTKDVSGLPDFCPNCGAEMDGGGKHG